MDFLRRFSSRRERLYQVFLRDRLLGARRYDRIAGYFRSSIFELVGEEIAQIPAVRVVCNSDLDERDLLVAQYHRESQLKARWNEVDPAEALLHGERYRRLLELLRSGRVSVRVVPRDRVFLHGKAGVIELADGRKTSFIGSVNESLSAFTTNYEIVWEDTSPEGVAWVEEEFEALWREAVPLPDAILEELERLTKRTEVSLAAVTAEPRKLAQAAFAEAPIYRGGQQLQPWQRSFVTMAVEHRERYGKVRLLLADEVGLGKTLSLGTAAVVLSLLDDGPVLVLCPASLALQWQVELWDRLGVPSAVWLSNDKQWLDYTGARLGMGGPDEVIRCPRRVGIVSTGLIYQETRERELLAARQYTTVVLDEAHRARRRAQLQRGGRGEANNLLAFMQEIALRTRHLLLGTATPIQTDVAELWDLLDVLDRGAGFVFGSSHFSIWRDPTQARDIVTGARQPESEREVWEWLRSPLPPETEHALFGELRQLLGLEPGEFNVSAKPYADLPPEAQVLLSEGMSTGFFELHNPVVRHTVLRRRQFLEDRGLLPRIGVRVHPLRDAPPTMYPGVAFRGLGLATNRPFELAYEAAEQFCELLHKRNKAAGFMKTLMRQRICSSFASGRATAERMLAGQAPEDEEDAEEIERTIAPSALTPDERLCLETIVDELSRPEARDPKLEAIRYFLEDHYTDGKTWLDHGCIIFSQYYDTVSWIAENLSSRLPGESIGVYAGAGKSKVIKGGNTLTVERDWIKEAVAKHEIRLLVATDAAGEGLNLQTLGTLINVDLPWNPSRLEQRLGRIKRIGQIRPTVDMLNLVYHETQDEKVYQAISKRMNDVYNIFGILPDSIEDEWIEDAEQLDRQLDLYLDMREKAKNAFEIRYEQSVDPNKERWELCAEVISRAELQGVLGRGWPAPKRRVADGRWLNEDTPTVIA